MKSVFEKYHDSGFACLPVKRDKSPFFLNGGIMVLAPMFSANAEGIGIICGKGIRGIGMSGFPDNHFGDAKNTRKIFGDTRRSKKFTKNITFQLKAPSAEGITYYSDATKRTKGNQKTGPTHKQG